MGFTVFLNFSRRRLPYLLFLTFFQRPAAPKRNALVHRAFQNFLMNTCIYTNIRLFYVLDRCLDPFSLFFADQEFDKL